MKFTRTVLIILVVSLLSFTVLSACDSEPVIHSQDLMSGITPHESSTHSTSNEVSLPDSSQPPVSFDDVDKESFEYNQIRLAVDLFKAMNSESQGENVLISPLSIQLALAMTANGAQGETLSEMEALLGGDMTIDKLNIVLKGYTDSLPSDEENYKFNIANSIWFRDDADRLNVEQSFLQTNADYYGAQVYKSNFDDPQTVEDVNNWVKLYTDGMIDKIIDEISVDTVMYLINALCFDAKWQKEYEKSDIFKSNFLNLGTENIKVEMMRSEESIYLEETNAKGFVKYYKDRKYAFAALLPNEGVDINTYVSSLTAESLMHTLNNAQSKGGIAVMPKFSYEYELSMNSVLKQLGMPTAFDSGNADFRKMATSTRGNIFIGDVLHKTFIQVDELGTKAGAVTKVEMEDECAPLYEWNLTLDRPFLYMIIDCENNLPIFIGTVTDLSE